MKTNIVVIVAVLLAVFLVGSLADYVYAYDGTNCRLRWGEAVGIGCQVPAELINVADVYTKELPAADMGMVQYRTRWGEPVATGYSVPVKIVTVAKEPKEVPAAVTAPAYRTRWGEPIGTGYR